MSSILLIGATGYVGGTVLSQLLNSTESSLRDLVIHLLVREDTQKQTLHEAYGDRVHTISWNGLEDTAFIEDTAAQYDIIINAGSGFIPAGSKAFVDGLARKVGTGSPVPWLIHTAGCTNLVDPTRKALEWNDEEDGRAIYEHEVELEKKAPYPQRTAELTVLERADSSGVRAVSVQAPCIFGEGTGLFNRQGLVIPLLTRYVINHGHGYKLNDTANFNWVNLYPRRVHFSADNGFQVHIEDIASYYVSIVRTILERPDRGVGYIPSGKEGILFPTVGCALITEMNSKALDVAFAAGILPREDTPQHKQIRLIPLQELADELAAGFCDIAEYGLGSEKAVTGTIGQKLLGWNPTRLESAWDQDFEDEMVAYMEGRRGSTFKNCIGAP
jgi:nucleoside-diphosphate-sugar epimerase